MLHYKQLREKLSIMPNTELPYPIQCANARRAYVALDRRIREALARQSPPTPEHRRALAALLLDGIEGGSR